jgi:LysR family hydrogen peroxide-inducible transcriptional activator
MLPRALPMIRRRFPELRLYLREDLTQKLIAGLKSGALDAALMALPYEASGISYAHVAVDELLAALPANHPALSRETLSLADLEAGGLILLEDGHCLREHALAACSLEAPRNTPDGGGFAATSLHTLVQMVGSGLGVSLLPAMAVEAGLTDAAPVAVRHLTEKTPSREIVVAWRAGSSREADARLLAETLKGVG